MACWPWIVPHERQGVNMDDFPNVGRWYEQMKTRPGLQRGFDVYKELRTAGMDAKAKEILFGQKGAARA
jgi:GST-like protein